jgi:hypothetical protein
MKAERFPHRAEIRHNPFINPRSADSQPDFMGEQTTQPRVKRNRSAAKTKMQKEQDKIKARLAKRAEANSTKSGKKKLRSSS